MSPSVGGWWRHLLISGFALTLLATLGVSYEQIGHWQDSQHRFRVGRAVDIGGRTLNIDCAGAGAPAVILEAGGGGQRRLWLEDSAVGYRSVHDSVLV